MTQVTGRLSVNTGEESVPRSKEITEPFADLGCGVYAALETYSNVHRGSGHFSMATTYLYEKSRDIVLEYLGLDKGKNVVIFCSPARAEALKTQLKSGSFQILSSLDTGVPLGIRALAVRRKALPAGIPFQTGGGTTRLVSPGWIVWADAPDRFEAGTPAVVNIIAFARALKMIKRSGINLFKDQPAERMTAPEILYHDNLDEFSGKKLLDELRKTMIGRGLIVPTTDGPKPFINLDNGASTPTFRPVWDTVYKTWQQSPEVQQEIIQEVRSICGVMLGAPLPSYDVIFTSNTTEAINLTAGNSGAGSEQDIEPVVLNTILEHTSNDLPWRLIPGASLIRLKTDPEGFLDLKDLEDLLSSYNQKFRHGRKRIKLLAITGASNVIGTFNDLEAISRLVHQYGVHLLVDGAQMVAHRKVDIEKWGIDYFAFSAHKLYAPFGTGVLVVRKGLLSFSPTEMKLVNSSGEENAGGIAALGKVLALLQRIGMDRIQEEEKVLTSRALSGMQQIKGLKVYGITDPGSPEFNQRGGVIAFTMKGIFSNQVARELAENGGIGIRYGCHCAHLLVKYLLNVPPALEKFQRVIAVLFHQVVFPGLARVSLGIGNSEEDIDTLIKVLEMIAHKRRNPEQKEARKQINDFVKAADQRVYFQP